MRYQRTNELVCQLNSPPHPDIDACSFAFPGIKNFVVDTTIQIASVEAEIRKQKTFLQKLNLLLVQARHQLRLTHVNGINASFLDFETRLASEMAHLHQRDRCFVPELVIPM